MNVIRWLPILCLIPACTGDDTPRDCDAGTPTCDSSLVIQFPDDRVDFQLTLTDDFGMNVAIACPDLDTGVDMVDGYTWTCGTGRATIDTHKQFGLTIGVAVGQGVPLDYTPDYQRGGDFCGNTCNVGTINL